MCITLFAGSYVTTPLLGANDKDPRKRTEWTPQSVPDHLYKIPKGLELELITKLEQKSAFEESTRSSKESLHNILKSVLLSPNVVWTPYAAYLIKLLIQKPQSATLRAIGATVSVLIAHYVYDFFLHKKRLNHRINTLLDIEQLMQKIERSRNSKESGVLAANLLAELKETNRTEFALKALPVTGTLLTSLVMYPEYARQIITYIIINILVEMVFQRLVGS